jgi:predicted glycosyltransferase
MDLAAVMRLRRRIIAESCRWFQPDVVMVEHYLDGLLGEMVPVLTRNRRRAGPGGFIAVAVSRGIIEAGGVSPGRCGPRRRANMLSCYDAVYCLDDPESPGLTGGEDTQAAPGAAPTAFLGRITDLCCDELAGRSQVCRRFRLPDKPMILLSLSRHGDVANLCLRLLETFRRAGIQDRYQVIFVVDPYLHNEVRERIQSHPSAANVCFLPFFYPLGDIINASDLVVCRAGYNTINEILLTGVRAIVVPEAHPSGEQEQRAKRIPRDNIVVLGEEEILRAPPVAVVRELMARPLTPLAFDFNKYAVAGRIITDLEGRFASRRDSS